MFNRRLQALAALILVLAFLLVVSGRRDKGAPRLDAESLPGPAGAPANPPPKSSLMPQTPGDSKPDKVDDGNSNAPPDTFVDYLAVREIALRKWRETNVDMRSGTLPEILADLQSRFRLIARADEEVSRDAERWLALRYEGKGDGYLSCLASAAGLEWMIDPEGTARLGTTDDILPGKE